MHRSQIILEDWQHEALKTLAERKGQSISELVREILSERLEEFQRSSKTGLNRIEGLGHAAGVAGRDHDAYLYGAEVERGR
jgi:predicted DNA-binding ribbon-helix-helix protein